MRHLPHNAQNILDISENEEYLFIKRTIQQYAELSEKIEDARTELEYEWPGKKKMFRRRALARLNKASNAISDALYFCNGEKGTLESKIINDMMSRPIAPRKVDLMVVQNDNDISINDDPEYSVNNTHKNIKRRQVPVNGSYK